MKILLTNDDGIEFPGILALYETLRKNHEVYIFAPAMEKSATSQAMTLFEDIYVKKINEHTFIVNGYPVDCVNIALHSGFGPGKYDLVISGINKGVNMGEDIFYSGTVGAARHAFIHDIPSLAVSCGYLDKSGDFLKVSVFIKKLIESPDFSLKSPFLWNINYPKDAKIPEEIKWTKSGKRIYRDTYKTASLSNNEYLLNLGGSELGNKETEGSDFGAFQAGYVSITPINKDGTDYSFFQQDP